MILLSAMIGPVMRADQPALADDLKKRVVEYAFREKPKLKADTELKIEEYAIDGLKELKLRVLFVRYLSPQGSQFNSALLIDHDGKLEPLAETFGGTGLQSAVVSDGKLYYTNSFGSGERRSHAGQVSIVKGEVVIAVSGPLFVLDEDLFVKKSGDSIVLETGWFHGFNKWDSIRTIGTISPKERGFLVLDDLKDEIPKLAGNVIEKKDKKK